MCHLVLHRCLFDSGAVSLVTAELSTLNKRKMEISAARLVKNAQRTEDGRKMIEIKEERLRGEKKIEEGKEKVFSPR